MKSKLILILLFASSTFLNTFSQSWILGVYSGFGINILDVEKSQDWELEDWNTYSILPYFEALYKLNDRTFLGAEIGAHRQYYWERRDDLTGYYYWGTLWTYNFSVLAETLVKDKLTVKSGLGLRTFSDESGSSVGIMFASDYVLASIGRFVIPLGLRLDFIPANAFTTSVNLTLGLRFAP
jgi:hypothetical protein